MQQYWKHKEQLYILSFNKSLHRQPKEESFIGDFLNKGEMQKGNRISC